MQLPKKTEKDLFGIIWVFEDMGGAMLERLL